MLEVDPENQQALIALLLSYTDDMIEQPGEGLRRAREVLPRLSDFRGDYLQLVRFINSLERDPLFFIIDSVDLGASNRAWSSCN